MVDQRPLLEGVHRQLVRTAGGGRFGRVASRIVWNALNQILAIFVDALVGAGRNLTTEGRDGRARAGRYEGNQSTTRAMRIRRRFQLHTFGRAQRTPLQSQGPGEAMWAVGEKAGDRDRTGDVQLGKQKTGVGEARKSKKKP